jgi:DNA-binding NarL/FixJ family response regulator
MTLHRTDAIADRDMRRAPLPLTAVQWTAIAQALALSPQQTRIVELILRGMKDKDIADELRLTVPTVRTYLSRIFSKLEVDDRVGLILHVFSLAQEFALRDQCHQT